MHRDVVRTLKLCTRARYPWDCAYSVQFPCTLQWNIQWNVYCALMSQVSSYIVPTLRDHCTYSVQCTPAQNPKRALHFQSRALAVYAVDRTKAVHNIWTVYLWIHSRCKMQVHFAPMTTLTVYSTRAQRTGKCTCSVYCMLRVINDYPLRINSAIFHTAFTHRGCKVRC